MQDRRPVRIALLCRTTIKFVVEDGFDRAVGAGSNIDGPLTGGIDACIAIVSRKPDNAEASAKALFGMRSLFQDQFA